MNMQSSRDKTKSLSKFVDLKSDLRWITLCMSNSFFREVGKDNENIIIIENDVISTEYKHIVSNDSRIHNAVFFQSKTDDLWLKDTDKFLNYHYVII